MEGQMVAPPRPPPLDITMNWNNNNSSSNCSTPYISAPSSPQRPINMFFCSAPTSPRSTSSVFFASDDGPPSPSAVVPFHWEAKPGVPKSTSAHNHEDDDDDDDDDFEFDFSGQLDMMVRPSLSSADELFDRGQIRPLKPPPVSVTTSPKSPKSPIMSKFREALSPRHRSKKTTNFNDKDDPFEAALRTTRRSEPEIPLIPKSPRLDEQTRGRSRNPTNPRTNSRKGMSRSLSPLRVSEFALLQQQQQHPSQYPNLDGSSSKSGKRWRLKDFLLFRSASDGRAAITGSGKDPLKKYFAMGSKRTDEGSFRSTTSSAGEGSVSRRRGRLSAHELHYTANKAVAEEMKKKTPLPFKHGGLLSCLGFNPALHKAFGSFASSS